MWLRRALAVGLLALGCAKGLAPTPAGVADPVAAMRARVAPPRLIGRFSVRVASPKRDVTLPGAVVLDGARGHVAILGPLGGPLATVQTDGQGVAVALSRGRAHYVAADAAAVLTDVSGGALGLRDLFCLWAGDPPLDAASERSRRRRGDGAVAVSLDGPDGTVVTEVANADGTLASIDAVTATGERRLTVRYGAYTSLPDGSPVPDALTIELPAAGVTLDVKVKEWTTPGEAPDVFGLGAPDGFTTQPLETLTDPWSALD